MRCTQKGIGGTLVIKAHYIMLHYTRVVQEVLVYPNSDGILEKQKRYSTVPYLYIQSSRGRRSN